MSKLNLIIILTVTGGVINFLIPRKVKGIREVISLIVTLVAFILSLQIYSIVSGNAPIVYSSSIYSILNLPVFQFKITVFNAFILMGITFFGLLTSIYSFVFMRDSRMLSKYYASLLFAVMGASLVSTADNLFLLLIGWEIVTIMLYFLVETGDKKAAASAQKTFVITGLSDCAMILGIGIILVKYNTLTISALSISTASPINILAYLLMLIGAMTKAGAIPFHTWIPEAAKDAPVPVAAMLPAAIDKLLGIYLLVVISLQIFKLTYSLSMTVMMLGVLTIVVAVLMAMVQHNLRKLLSFHAISQVGYMMLGIGTGTALGVAGGIFHMINNAIYKSCLFFCSGNVEKAFDKTELDEMGGAARYMPFTFIFMAIAALAISGVPPFNGFASKWMIYQGVINLSSKGSWAFAILLTGAMFGSALTLASFVKVIHSIFFGEKVVKRELQESPFLMLLPSGILALLCIVFGLFYWYPLNKFIVPGLSLKLSYIGVWRPVMSTFFLILALVIGFIIYLIGSGFKVRTTSRVFVGGEILEDTNYDGTQFYQTFKRKELLGGMYKLADDGVGDIYKLGIFYGGPIINFLKWLHDGVVSTYLAWCVAGIGVMTIIILFLIRG